MKRYFYFNIYCHKIDEYGCGEVVIKHDVPTTLLTSIWVYPSRRVEMVTFLKKNNIETINQIAASHFID